MKDQSQIRWREQCESDFFLVINDNVELFSKTCEHLVESTLSLTQHKYSGAGPNCTKCQFLHYLHNQLVFFFVFEMAEYCEKFKNGSALSATFTIQLV